MGEYDVLMKMVIPSPNNNIYQHYYSKISDNLVSMWQSSGSWLETCLLVMTRQVGEATVAFSGQSLRNVTQCLAAKNFTTRNINSAQADEST